KANMSLGAFELGQGQPECAERRFRAALAAQPNDPVILHQLGRAGARQGDWKGAADYFNQAARLSPDKLAFQCSLAQSLWHLGQRDVAQHIYTKPVVSNPHWPDAVAREARLRASYPDASARDGLLALELAEQACQATQFTVPAFIEALAAAYAELGRFDD